MQSKIVNRPSELSVEEVAVFAEHNDLTLVVDGKSYRLMREHANGYEEVIHVFRDTHSEQWALSVLCDILESYE